MRHKYLYAPALKFRVLKPQLLRGEEYNKRGRIKGEVVMD